MTGQGCIQPELTHPRTVMEGTLGRFVISCLIGEQKIMDNQWQAEAKASLHTVSSTCSSTLPISEE